MKSAAGLVQLGGGAQVTLATQPRFVPLPSVINLKVREPSALVEVNGPGMVAPQNPPGTEPGTFPGGFVLKICGADTEFPLKTYKASKVASVLNDVKVTVTLSPGFVGLMVTVELVLLA